MVDLLQAKLGVTRELAEDAWGLAWLQLVRLRPSGDRVLGWLYTVAKHEAFALRDRMRTEGAGDHPALVAIDVDYEGIIEARDALRIIARLKPQQRQVLLLRAEGHSYRAICDLTGQTYTNVIWSRPCQRPPATAALALTTCRRGGERRRGASFGRRGDGAWSSPSERFEAVRRDRRARRVRERDNGAVRRLARRSSARRLDAFVAFGYE